MWIWQINYWEQKIKMKTFKQLTEGLFSGYTHTVENLEPYEHKFRHVFTHKDHQFIIKVSDKDSPYFSPDSGYMSVKMKYLPTGRTLIDNVYSTHKLYPPGAYNKWDKTVSGTYFSGNKIDDVKRNKMIKNLISHVKKHIGMADFSSDINDHISQTDVEGRTDYQRSHLDEIVRNKDQWVYDPDVPFEKQPRNPMRGGGENIINAGWYPSQVFHPKEPHVTGVSSFIHPRENNHRINVDYNSMEWEHVDTNKGGNGHIASGRTSEGLKRHLSNWVKIRKS